MSTTELMGHHLRALKRVHSISRTQMFLDLSQDPCAEDDGPRKGWVPYVTSPQDDFMKVSYDDLKALLARPNGTIRLVSKTPDFICAACPQTMKNSPYCTLFNARKSTMFDTSETRTDLGDIAAAREFGLEIGKDYTARQIIEALGLQKYYSN